MRYPRPRSRSTSRRTVRSVTPRRSASSAPGQWRCVCSRLSSESARVVVSDMTSDCQASRTGCVRYRSYLGYMANEPIIQAHGLTKRFTVKKKSVEAVTDLTFEVERGELVAFLGPNGAGKSTSLRMLTTLIPPTAGTAHVVGYDILRSPADVRARLGYVGQLTSGSFSQRVRDELLSQGAFYGMSKAAARTRADELIESLDLTGFATRSVQQLSGGQKRR